MWFPRNCSERDASSGALDSQAVYQISLRPQNLAPSSGDKGRESAIDPSLLDLAQAQLRSTNRQVVLAETDWG